MFEVTVETGFSSGHYLRNYQGGCENPHGHNYKVRITLAGEVVEDNGLLLDFKCLKEALRPTAEYLDHQMINELPPFTEINPSAENLARYFFEKVSSRIAAMTGNRVKVKECTLYETNKASATFYV